MNSSSIAPPRRRIKPVAIALQALVLAAVLALLAWLVHNTSVNLRERGVASGFGFVHDAAGFAISEGLYPYEIGDNFLHAFAAGIVNTLRAAIPAAIFASLLGFALGIAQVSRHVLISRLARTYVDVVRNIPLLVQLLLWYIMLTASLPGSETPLQWEGIISLSKGGLHVAMPDAASGWWALLAGGVAAAVVIGAWRRLLGPSLGRWGAGLLVAAAVWWLAPIGWDRPAVGMFGVTGGASLSTEWLALVCGLSLFSAAYCAEIVRAGLQAVPRGQWEASHALGLTRNQTLRQVVVPQGLRVMLPPYTSLLMNTLKNSSLGVAIGYPELVSVASTSLNQTGQAIECIAVIASVYLCLNMITALAMSLINSRVQIKER